MLQEFIPNAVKDSYESFKAASRQPKAFAVEISNSKIAQSSQSADDRIYFLAHPPSLVIAMEEGIYCSFFATALYLVCFSSAALRVLCGTRVWLWLRYAVLRVIQIVSSL